MECRYTYRFTEKAEQDLDEILRYISMDLVNPTAARNLGRKVFEKIDMVRAFPDSGAPVEMSFWPIRRFASFRLKIMSFTTKPMTKKKQSPSSVSFTAKEISMRY